ncbi:hypothetical protein F5Y01DRAFT_282429 [Xylaria sp. FL0043]|nr:hypothetical protein F5Y01DRAFT_282429 [Xylaria sp. FL0043]
MDVSEEMGSDQGLEQNNAGACSVAPAQRQAKKRVVTAARKEQNKLAQRAYRKRQREQKRVQKQFATPGLRRLEPRRGSLQTLCEPAAVSCSGRSALTKNSYNIVNPSSPSSTQDASQTTPDPNGIDLLAMDLQSELEQSSPSSTSRSKVSASSLAKMAATLLDGPDVRPIGLINMALGIRGSLEDNSTTVFRACLSNAICIGIDLTELMYCERPCMSPFYRPTAQANEDQMALAAASHESLPDSLKPTPAQILIPHHASLDLIPLPRLRERAILMCAALPRTFSLWEMKLDIYTRNALVCQNRNSASGSVLQPWDMRSWQAAPWFLCKWKAVVDTDEVKTSLSIPGIPGLWM